MNSGHSLMNSMSNGFNIAGMMKGVNSGRTGGQRVMQIIPAILSML